MATRKISTYLINPKFQFKMMFLFFWPLIGLSVANLIAVQMFFDKLKDQGRSAGFSADHVFFVFLDKQYQSLFSNLSASFVVASLFFIGLGFYFSHRVAGPLHRMKISMEKMRTEKKLNSIQFRDGDYFQEIKDEFNRLIQSIKGKPE